MTEPVEPGPLFIALYTLQPEERWGALLASHRVWRLSPEGECPEEALVAVLDAAAWPDEAALFAALSRVRVPALIVCSPSQTAALAERLPWSHDLCEEGASAALLTHRLHRLIATRRFARDPLTGLWDRQSFLFRLKEALQRATPAAPLSLLMVDLDRFKQINDLYGHQVGDDVLQEIGHRLLGATSPGTLLARFGGEEFTILVPGGEPEAQALAERALRAVRARPCASGIEARVSLSGVTAQGPMRRRLLLQQAEQAMYAAKAQGRDRFVHFAALERDALAQDTDLAARSFEDMTRVVSERIAETIAWRGRRLLEEIKHQADQDALTGLYSRGYLDRRLGWEFERSRSQARDITVALLDIDHFGQVNKDHGWRCGDRVLRDLAQIVVRNVRGDDWVARYGGEELCLVMRGTRLEDAAVVLERIRRAIAEATFSNDQGEPFQMSVSVGADARREEPEETLEALLRRVSQRLLEAKRGGRDRVCADQRIS
jgi:two-component system cell cycle response regulator